MNKPISGYFIYRTEDKKDFTSKIASQLEAQKQKTKLEAAYARNSFSIGKFVKQDNGSERKEY